MTARTAPDTSQIDTTQPKAINAGLVDAASRWTLQITAPIHSTGRRDARLGSTDCDQSDISFSGCRSATARKSSAASATSSWSAMALE